MAVRRAGSVLLLVAALALAGYAKFRAASFRQTGSRVARLNRELPPLPVIDSDGREVELGKVSRGSKSVIVFYSPSCPICRAVLPELRSFPGSLKLLLVREEAGERAGSREAFSIANALHFIDSNRVLLRSFPMSAVPTVLFVDEAGFLREAWVGSRVRGHLAARISAFAHQEP